MGVAVSQLITDVQEIIGETTGSGVQTYGEAAMLGTARRAFNLIYKKFAWPQYRAWFSDALDELTGAVVTDNLFDGVQDFDDFFAVYRNGQSVELPRLPRGINPYTVTGTSLRYWTSLPVTHANYATKRLQFWPLASVETVNVGALVYPVADQAWTPDDTMDFDRDLLGYAMAFLTLNNDDINPSAAETNRILMEARFKDITARLASVPIPISGVSGLPDSWAERP